MSVSLDFIHGTPCRESLLGREFVLCRSKMAACFKDEKGTFTTEPKLRQRVVEKEMRCAPQGLERLKSVSKTQALERAQPEHPPHCFPTWQPAREAGK